MTFREAIDSLPPPAKQKILYAADNDIPHFERLPNGRFIGVHIGDGDKRVKVMETLRHWSMGIVR